MKPTERQSRAVAQLVDDAAELGAELLVLGIFQRTGPYWMHYRGEQPGGPFQIVDPGHDPVVTWRPAPEVAVVSEGPFRDFAEVARADPSTPYVLIIDEINRAKPGQGVRRAVFPAGVP